MQRKHPLAKCEECPLADKACAPTIGPKDAKVAVVSRSPGFHEARVGKPFSGPSGKVLDHLLEQNGVKRNEILATNVVLCHTDSPPKEAIAACSDRLRSELDNTSTIIACGSEAVNELIGGSVSGNRGYAHRGKNGTRTIATNNPAIVLRDDTTFPDLIKDFRLALNPQPEASLPEVRWTNESAEATEWIRSLMAAKSRRYACDIESRGLAHDSPIVSFGISTEGDTGIAFAESVCSDTDFINSHLRRFLESQDSIYVWHNGKFDVRNLRYHGTNTRVDEDTLLLSYVLDERSTEEGIHSLDYLLMDVLAWPFYEPLGVTQFKANSDKKNPDGTWKYPVPDELYEYNALDAAGTAQLLPVLKERIREDGVEGVYNFLLKLIDPFIRMELNGCMYDIDTAADLHENEMMPLLNELRLRMQMLLGDGGYNPNSAPQNSKLVYDTWNARHTLKRPSSKARSVDKPVYTELKEGRFRLPELDEQRHKLVREWATQLAEFKTWDKQRSTYIEGLIKQAVQRNGRIHTNVKIHGTVSGRPSSSDPNLFNITRPKEGLPNIRSLFKASEGRSILNVDFSQAEMRCIAHLSQDPKLKEIYDSGVSLHRVVAERFYGKDYTGEQYVHAKNMDFGVAYGQSAITFQEKHDIPMEEGDKFIKWWWGEFSAVADWRDSIHEELLKEGYVQTEFGRKRRWYLVTNQNKGEVLREAVNFIPQSTASDFTLWSIIQLDKELDPKRASIILTVYDSIVADIDTDYVSAASSIFKDIMESAPKESLGWQFPFEVEIKIGENWGDVS